MDDSESVRLRADVASETYDEIAQKAPVPARAGKTHLMHHIIQEWLEYKRHGIMLSDSDTDTRISTDTDGD
ncbi:hypothetical protein NDI85_19635 [Halomicroarcula sp. S1AR25-4]|uniref:hypothetical protein n=1 Tax=Haloarcula sp. S1AR25-4 TaxID=2950538 RepID=UPI002876498B|nr:hypothetical protein [Halomicroarcula sp. S1AR25-4]MDS0280000.1 hypothetical protein [Halomicroarcula sp. S1AR25-4]